MEPVQKELKLSTDQTTAVHDTADSKQCPRCRKSSRASKTSRPKRRREKMQELRGEAETKVKELRGKVDLLLDASQKERLKQLTIQRRGAFGAMQDPEVVASLKLSDDQKRRSRRWSPNPDPAAEQGGAGGGGGGAGGGDREAMRERFQAMQKERNDKVLAILTAEQKAELEKMQGPKFDFPAGAAADSPAPRTRLGVAIDPPDGQVPARQPARVNTVPYPTAGSRRRRSEAARGNQERRSCDCPKLRLSPHFALASSRRSWSNKSLVRNSF